MRSFLGVFVGRKVFDARLAAEPTLWPTARGQLRCNRCQRQTSVTAGTIFEGTRKPLRLWFQAMWYVTNQKHGVSALGLQRILGLGSYQTAWAWLHKLRRAMVRPGRDLLGGAVEVDETYVGGRETGVVGRQTKTKSIVAIAAEVRGRGTGRIRMSRVEDVAARSFLWFIVIPSRSSDRPIRRCQSGEPAASGAMRCRISGHRVRGAPIDADQPAGAALRDAVF